MALQDLNPSADGDYAGWSLIAGASKWQAVAPPDDDLTSYIEIARTTNDKYSAVVGSKPAGISAVNGVKVGLRARTTNNQTDAQFFNTFARFGGTDGANTDHANFGGTFETSGPLTVARPGGGSWTVADVYQATLQVGVYIGTWENPDPGECGVTSLWLELDYAPPIGALVFGIIGSLGPIAASGLLLSQMGAVAREVCRRTPYRLRIQPHEYEQAWRELRDHRYPVRWFRPALASL